MARADVLIRFTSPVPALVGPARLSRAATIPTPTVSDASTLPGWQLTKANSDLASKGLDPAAFTPYTGPYAISNTTLTRRRINLPAGEVLNLGSNTILDECQITGSAYAILLSQGSPTNVQVLGCDVLSNGTPGTVRSVEQKLILFDGVRNFQIRGGYAQGGTIGLESNNYQGTTTDYGDVIEDWCLGGMQYSNGGGSDPHVDGFTRRAGRSRLVVSRCRFDIGYYVSTGYTGACFLQPTYAAIGGARFEDCLFSGGGNDLVVESGTTWEIVNNRFGGLHYGPGYKLAAASFAAWSSNNYYAAGSPPEYRGAVINAFT